MFLQPKETSRNKTNPASTKPCKTNLQKKCNKKRMQQKKEFVKKKEHFCLRLIGSQFFIHCQEIFGQFQLKLASIEKDLFLKH